MDDINQNVKKPISILRIVSAFYPVTGGSVSHVIELIHHINPYVKRQIIICPSCKSMDCLKFDHDFIVPVKRVKDTLLQHEKWNKFVGVSIVNRFFFGYNITKAVIDMKKQNIPIDIIQIHDFHLGLLVNFLLKIKGFKKPVIIMCHGTPFGEDLGYNSIQSKITNFIFSNNMILIKKPDFIILLDDGTLGKTIVKSLQDNNFLYKIVYHAIDTDVYNNSDNIGNNDEFVILSAHRLEPWKSVDIGIYAFQKLFQLLNSNPKIKLKIAGIGSETDRLKKIVNTLGLQRNVFFLGNLSIKDTRNEILAADVIIGTSQISNIGRFIQESMSCAKPVVIFSEDNNELFSHLENCLISKPGDFEQFIKNLKLVYEDEKLRKYLGKNARNTIIKQRSWDIRLKEELDVYEKINNRNLL